MAEQASTYDGFISYSHAADDLLAPRLQAALQRFAKPWWKRRAVRIFRDESSLSANPHLWSSITEALDTSGWFVLLLSPDAASSEWVNQEIAYWVEHRDPKKILPVVTDGAFAWTDGDVTGDAVPEALRGVFSGEPRWVDLRGVDTETELDLQNPEFAAAVADIASTIRGVPKDELASEEVRQHRRTVRTAWAAGVLVSVLAAAAIGFAIQSADNAEEATSNAAEADQQRQTAEANAHEAARQADIAEANAEAEREARAEADVSAQLARSQEFAAASTSVLDFDPELASLLAVLSIQSAPGEAPPESVRALRKADQANLLLRRVEVTGESFVSLTPDDRSIIAFNDIGQSFEVVSYDLATSEVNWRTSVTEYFTEGLSTALAPDGSYAVLTGRDEESKTGALLVLSLVDGGVLEALVEECPRLGWQESGSPFTPDGTVIAITSGTAECETDPEESWVSFRDTTTWEEVDRFNVPGYFEVVQFDEKDGNFLLTDIPGNKDSLELRSYPEMELLQTFTGYGGRQSALSPTGGFVAYTSSSAAGVRIHAANSGEFLGWVEGEGAFLIGTSLLFSPDGNQLLVMSEEGVVLVDSATGKLITRLGSSRGVLDASFTQDGTSLVTTYLDQIETWDLAPTSGALSLSVDGSDVVWANPNRFFEGPNPGMLVFVGVFPTDMVAWLVVVDDETGEIREATQAASAAPLPDGRFALLRSTGTFEDRVFLGLSVWDPEDSAFDHITDCQVPEATFSPETLCPNGEPVFGLSNIGLAASPDASLVAAVTAGLERPQCLSQPKLVRVWDIEFRLEVITIEIPGCDDDLRLLGDTWMMTTKGVYSLEDGSLLAQLDAASNVYELTPNGRFVLAVEGGPSRGVLALDTTNWEEIAQWDAHDARIRGMAVSPSGDRVATTGSDGLIRIWDLAAATSGDADRTTPQLLDEIPIGIASDAYWISEDSLGVLFRNGSWTTVSLDANELAANVLSGLQRSFTATECENYRIDPCPTLEELRES